MGTELVRKVAEVLLLRTSAQSSACTCTLTEIYLTYRLVQNSPETKKSVVIRVIQGALWFEGSLVRPPL